MAQRGRQQELFALAVASLRATGYSFSEPGRGRFGRNVRVLTRHGESETVLIQTRSHQPQTARYLVGIMVADLERVDVVVLYFEGEGRYIKVPASFLRDIHSRMKERGLARYTGPHDQQWRVDIHLSGGKLSPQGSDGEAVRHRRVSLPGTPTNKRRASGRTPDRRCVCGRGAGVTAVAPPTRARRQVGGSQEAAGARGHQAVGVRGVRLRFRSGLRGAG